LTKLNKLKAFKYGGDYLTSLKAENEQLQKQIKLNKEKIEEAKEYAKIDKDRLKDMATKGVDMEWVDKDGKLQTGTFTISVTPEFDEDGNVDVDQYLADLEEEYNKKVDEWNNLSAEEQENRQAEFDAWFDQYDKLMDVVDNLEEAQDRVAEAIAANLEVAAQISANNLEDITYSIELKIDTNEFQKTWDELIRKRWSKDLTKLSDIARTYLNDVAADLSSLSQYSEGGQGYQDAYQKYQNYLAH